MVIYILLTIWIFLVNAFFAGKALYIDDGNCFGMKTRVPEAQLLFTVLPLIFIIGMRSGHRDIVNDTSAYISAFRNLKHGLAALFSPSSYKGKSDFLFKFLGIACKTISGSYHFYFLVIAFISGMLLANSLRDYTEYYSIAILLFMINSEYGWMINGIRQFLAVTIVFYGSRYIAEKQLFRFLVFCGIAVLLHKSAIVMVPMYFIVNGRAWNKKTILFIALGVFAISFLTPFIRVIEFASLYTGFEGYIQQFEEDNGSSVIRTIVYAVPAIMAFIKRREIEKVDIPFINICINMSVVCAITSLIANYTSGLLMGRIPIYFSLYSLVLLPWLINETSYKKYRRLITFAMFFFYAVFSYVEGIPGYYSNVLFNGKYFPSS